MTIKLIAIDLDGTLLNPQLKITKRVKQTIQAARKKGVMIIIATGRPFIGVQHYLFELNLQYPGQYCITNNGALLHKADTGECIAESLLSFNDYLYIEKLARQLGVHFQALTKKDLFTPNKDISQYTVQDASMTGIPLHHRYINEMNRALHFPKVMMVDHAKLLNNAIQRIPKTAWNRYSIFKSSPFYLEIMNKGVNKGNRIKILAELLDIKRNEVMAIGDQENDIAILEYAGVGVAMGNSIDALKEVAQFITLANFEDGVAHAIEQFVL